VAIPFIDTLSPAYDADIHAAHRTARAQHWYATTPAGIIVLRHEDVRAVLHDRRWRELGAAALRLAGIESGPLWDWFHQILSNKEGEEHARLRRLVSQAFTPRSVERLRPVMRATADEFIDRFAGAERCEFVSAFAAPYPVRVIGALLGVPPGDFARFHAWSSDLSLAFGSRIAGAAAHQAALVSLSGYVDELLAERRRSPSGPDQRADRCGRSGRSPRCSRTARADHRADLRRPGHHAVSARVRDRTFLRTRSPGSSSRRIPASRRTLPRRSCATSPPARARRASRARTSGCASSR
jgi:cytochrome P450